MIKNFYIYASKCYEATLSNSFISIIRSSVEHIGQQVFQCFWSFAASSPLSQGTLMILRFSFSVWHQVFRGQPFFLFPPGGIQYSAIFGFWSLGIHKIRPTSHFSNPSHSPNEEWSLCTMKISQQMFSSPSALTLFLFLPPSDLISFFFKLW